jgi:hypothetical protein
MNTNTNPAPEREEIEQLLPWHAAGTLSRRDAQKVEQAIASDPELARQFALVREELSETIHLNETLGAPSARAMEKLFAGIETESGPATQARPKFSLATWIAERLTTLSPRTLAYAAAAAAIAIVLQFGVLTGVAVNTALNPGAPATYQTASGPEENAPTGGGSHLLINFAPGASMADITSFLERNGLTLVDGPRAGMYRVRISGKALPRAEVEQIVTRLRAETAVVRFVAVAD